MDKFECSFSRFPKLASAAVVGIRSTAVEEAMSHLA
jgi:hypothetical protein